MKSLLYINDTIALIVFCAAVIAGFAQLKIHNLSPAIPAVENAVLHKWHRWAGWLAIGGFVLNRMVYLRAGEALPAPFGPRSFAHGFLIALCVIAVLRKVWVTQNTVNWNRKRIAAWRISVFILGASFFALFAALTTWRWLNPTLTWDAKEQLIYTLAISGHIGLATALIWLGRSALTHRYRSNQITSFAACAATGRTETITK